MVASSSYKLKEKAVFSLAVIILRLMVASYTIGETSNIMSCIALGKNQLQHKSGHEHVVSLNQCKRKVDWDCTNLSNTTTVSNRKDGVGVVGGFYIKGSLPHFGFLVEATSHCVDTLPSTFSYAGLTSVFNHNKGHEDNGSEIVSVVSARAIFSK